MPKRKIFDVIGLGQCCVDYVLQVESFPSPDQKLETESPRSFGGGPVATALVAASRLGLKTAFCGVVGDDPFAEKIRAGLLEENIDCTGLLRRENSTSQSAFIIAESKTAQRTILWNRGSSFPLKPEEIEFSLIEKSKFLHLDGLHLEASISAAEFARKHGIKTMLDTGTYRPGIERLLTLVDYFIAGEGFAKHFSADFKQALRIIKTLGPETVGVTLGRNGAMLFQADEFYYQPAFRVDAIDTTGCGDAFHGGAIFSILNNFPPEELLSFSSAVAALKSRSPGGRLGLPQFNEVQEFLAKKPATYHPTVF